MTDCKTIQQRFDDYRAHALADGEANALEAHVQACPACREALEAHRAWSGALAGLPFEPPSADFEDRVMRAALDRKKTRQHRRAFLAGFGTALAASLALAAVLLAWWQPQGGEALRVVEVQVAPQTPVRLVIRVDRPVQQASLVLELPEGVELAGHEGQQRLEWQAPLAAGNNILSLPVRMKGSATGELVARVRIDGRERAIRVRLRPALRGAGTASPTGWV
ncbi:MAG: hypothetical protein D6717_11585 [Gammaproteobacteria bacterium]|nr:MAG: hypothetical protein D6717_11585 [Gammaproteobacteria bacterium]